MGKPLSMRRENGDDGSIKDVRRAVAPSITPQDLRDGDPRKKADDDEDDDDEDEDDDDLDEQQDTDEEDINAFDGFNDKNKGSDDAAELRRELKETQARLAQLEASRKAPDVDQLTPQQFEELSKKDPRAALTMLVSDVMKSMKSSNDTDADAVAKKVTKDMSQREMVREFRRLIQTKFDPKTNIKLRDAAYTIFQQRGFDSSADPAAEYIAFTLAAERFPDLAPQQTRRGRSSRASDSQPSKGGGRGKSMSIDPDLKQIALRWGVDTSKPKAVKRLETLRRHYETRRIDTGRTK